MTLPKIPLPQAAMETEMRPRASDLERAGEFLNTLAARRSTALTYRYALGILVDFLQVTRYMTSPFVIAGLRDDLLLAFYEWLVEQQFAPGTIDTYLAAAKRLLIWLDAHDRLPPGFQVGKAVNRLKEARGTRRRSKTARKPDPGLPQIVTYFDDLPLPDRLAPDARRKRLEILRARAIVHTLYASAGRVSEVGSLTREMALDGRANEVRITGKGDKDRLLLLTKEAKAAIRAYLRERDDAYPALFISHGKSPGRALGRKTLWLVVKTAARALGLYKGTSPHAFRHFRAQQLLHEGMDLDVLQVYLGHTDISTTRQVYAPHTDLRKVKDQIGIYGRTAREETQAMEEKDV